MCVTPPERKTSSNPSRNASLAASSSSSSSRRLSRISAGGSARAAARAAEARVSCTYTLSSERAGVGRLVTSAPDAACATKSGGSVVPSPANASRGTEISESEISGGAGAGAARVASSTRSTQSGAHPLGATSARSTSASSARRSRVSPSRSARSDAETASCAAASKNAYAASASSFSSSSDARRSGWRANAASTACVVERSSWTRDASRSAMRAERGFWCGQFVRGNAFCRCRRKARVCLFRTVAARRRRERLKKSDGHRSHWPSCAKTVPALTTGDFRGTGGPARGPRARGERDAPFTTSGVMRLNGARQCGARACSTPFALDPVSRSVSSRSWKASQTRLSSAPTKGSPGRCPRAGARASCAASDVPTPGACTTSQSRSDGASDDAPSRRTASSSIVERGGDDAKSGEPSEFYRKRKTNKQPIATRRFVNCRVPRADASAKKKPSTPPARREARPPRPPPLASDRAARGIHIAPAVVSARRVS